MNYQDRYDELENIVNTLDNLADETKDKYYRDMINELKYEAQNELDEVEDKLYQQKKEEQRELEIGFDKERL